MKKLLALVLALVMVMGLATVGTSAAKLADYSDKADINYDEAVAVMSSVGVLEGADGKFRPAAQLKRSEAAKIVAFLNTNKKTAEGLVGTGKFADVPTNHWAAGYVDYLTTVGVIAGKSATSFDPDGDLTAVQFAKMLLVVLGYDPKIEGLVGADYKIFTMKLATDAGLFTQLGDLTADSVLTREQAAQMAFNTVCAPLVEYTNKGGQISVNGATVNIGASNASYVTTTIASQQNIDDRQLTNTGINLNQNGGYTVEFGERQYTKLVKTNVFDDFGRPANKWVNDKEKVGTFVNKNKLIKSWTTAVTGADLYDAIGESKIENSKIIYKFNGVDIDYVDPAVNSPVLGNLVPAATNMIRGNKVPYTLTGNGVLTEAYEKGNNIYVVSIATQYAEAASNYNESAGTLTINTWNGNHGKAQFLLNGAAAIGMGVNVEIKAEDFPEVTKYKKNDKLLVRFAYLNGEWEVAEILEPTVVTAASVNKYSVSDPYANKIGAGWLYEGYVNANGEQKDFSKLVYIKSEKMQTYANDALDTDYDIVYDTYGYAIAVKPVSEKTQYIFLAGVDISTSNLGTKTADAYGVLSDGTALNFKLNVEKTNTKIADYTALQTNANYDGGKYSKDGGTTAYWPNKNSDFQIDDDWTVDYDPIDGNEARHAYNRWFTYSVSGEGANAIYTLTPCANMIMAYSGAYGVNGVNNGALNTVDSKAAYNTRLVINPKTARLIGDANDYDQTDNTAWTNASLGKLTAYGSEDSKYITVKTAKVDAAGIYGTALDDGALGGVTPGTPNEQTTYRRGITKVTGIYTGVQNVSLRELANVTLTGDEDTAKKQNPFNEAAWAVYDDANRIIACIFMGEELGNSGNFVYAVEKSDKEWKEGDTYFWQFKAIVDGELKTLTVKTRDNYDGLKDTINQAVSFGAISTYTVGHATMANRSGLLSVTYDKDGNVTEALAVDHDQYIGNTASNDDVYGVPNATGTDNTGGATANGLAKEIEDEKVWTISLFDNHGAPDDRGSAQISYKANGRTLSANTGTADIALTVPSNARIWVIQENYYAANGGTSTTVKEYSDFEQAIGSIAKGGADLVTGIAGKSAGATKSTTSFGGYVSAALDSNGRAKWVVLKNVNTQLYVDNNSGKEIAGPATVAVTLSEYNPATGFTAHVTGFKNNGTAKVTLSNTYGANSGDVTGTANLINGYGTVYFVKSVTPAERAVLETTGTVVVIPATWTTGGSNTLTAWATYDGTTYMSDTVIQ